LLILTLGANILEHVVPTNILEHVVPTNIRAPAVSELQAVIILSSSLR